MRILHLTISALLPVASLAQCEVLEFTVAADCGSDAPEATVVLAGGEPPYQLQFNGANGAVVVRQSMENGAFVTDMGDFLYTVLVPPVNLVVTDANGCTTTASTSFPQHALCIPEVWFDRACSASTSLLFWSGTYYHAGAGDLLNGLPDPCNGASYSYEIASQSNGPVVSSGSFSGNWTQQANGFWRFNTPLPHGAYYVKIHPTTNPDECQNGAVTYCYRDKGAITDPTADGCGQRFKLRFLLGGAMANPGSSMRDSLRVKGLLPVTEPYSALGYTYVGTPPGQSIAPVLLNTSGINALVDWVVVELRSSSAPATVLHSMPALVQRDGRVVGLNGSTTLRAPLGPERLYVAVRHRNHLGVMTAAPQWVNFTPLVSEGTTLIDLRSGLFATFGTNAQQPNGSNFCLWPGDANFDGQVKYTGPDNDRDVVLSAVGGSTPTNVANNVYSGADVNMDGVVKYVGPNNDRDIILQTIGGAVPTAVRTQQLP
jgi:hypothetical protein